MSTAILIKSDGNADSNELSAYASDVIKGKTAITHDSDGEPIVGTLVLNGNAAASQVLKDKTFYTTNPKSKITGTMANITAVDQAKSVALSNGVLYIRMSNGAHITNATSGYPEVSSSQASVATAIGLTAGKLLKGQTVLGVAGTATSDATATTGDILTGKTAYINGSKITGTIASLGAQTVTPGNTQKVVSCSGKYMTGNVTVPAVSGLVASNIKKGAVVGGVTGTYEGKWVYRPGTNGGWGIWTNGNLGSGGIYDSSSFTVKTELPVNLSLYKKCYAEFGGSEDYCDLTMYLYKSTTKSIKMADNVYNTKGVFSADISADTESVIIGFYASNGSDGQPVIYSIWLE